MLVKITLLSSIIIPSIILIVNIFPINHWKIHKKKHKKVRFKKKTKIYKYCYNCKLNHLLSECPTTSFEDKINILNKLRKTRNYHKKIY